MNSTDEKTQNLTNTSTAEELQVPQWIFIIYFILLCCGSLMNLVHTLALLRCRRNGTLSLILQLALVDSISFYVSVSEILTLNEQTWSFRPEWCPFYKGTEILTNSLTIYLLVCFNFHVISLWGLHDLEMKSNNKNPLTSCNSNHDDSNECLVLRRENANRIVTIDYRKKKSDVSVVFPIIFVWFVSLSLSVPNYTLSSTLKINENYTLCAIIDVYYGQILQHLLLTFKIIVPVSLLALTLIILTVRLSQTSKKNIDNVLTNNFMEIRMLLIFSIALTILFVCTSLQRQLLHFVHVISYSFNRNNINNFKMPPLYNNHLTKPNLIYLAMLHYSGGTWRALLCSTMLPKFRRLVKSKIFVCIKEK